MTTLEKIRAEIDVIEINGQVDEHTAFIRTGEHVKQMALDIIDKYAEQEPCEDVVSRQAVLQAVSEGCFELRGVYGRCEELINALPSVRPQEQTGHWIDADGDNAICSCCNRLNHLYGEHCKHCGAKMESEDKE